MLTAKSMSVREGREINEAMKLRNGFCVLVAALVAWQMNTGTAAAQDPTSTVNRTVVAPGQASTVLVTGVPGYYSAGS